MCEKTLQRWMSIERRKLHGSTRDLGAHTAYFTLCSAVASFPASLPCIAHAPCCLVCIISHLILSAGLCFQTGSFALLCPEVATALHSWLVCIICHLILPAGLCFQTGGFALPRASARLPYVLQWPHALPRFCVATMMKHSRFALVVGFE
jgi:hypothetical protein